VKSNSCLPTTPTFIAQRRKLPCVLPHQSWGPISRPLPHHTLSKTVRLTYLCMQLSTSRSSAPHSAFTNEFLPLILRADFPTTYAVRKTTLVMVRSRDTLARRRTRHHPSFLTHSIATAILLQLRSLPPILPSPSDLFLVTSTSIRKFRLRHSLSITS